MCEREYRIKFCTKIPKEEIIHNQKSRKNHRKEKPYDYKWILYRIVGVLENFDVFSYQSKDKLNNELTAEMVLIVLNSENCFDFSYNAQDGDYLSIYSDEETRDDFMSFVYRLNKWKINEGNSSEARMEKIARGWIFKE